MKKLKIFTDIEESYNELVYMVSWPTKSQLVESSIVVMAASILIALMIFAMDWVIDAVMHLIYGLGF